MNENNETSITDVLSKLGMDYMIYFAVLAITGLMIMIFWNASVPQILDLSSINYIQAIFLKLLFDTLFHRVKVKNDE